MAYSNGLVTIETTPTVITNVPQLPQGRLLTNTGPATVYLGGPTVAASGANQGLPLPAAASVIELAAPRGTIRLNALPLVLPEATEYLLARLKRQRVLTIVGAEQAK